MTPSLCFQARPREGEDYVGYVFALTRGKARALAMQSEPASEWPYSPGDFTAWSVRRRPTMDGQAPVGAAWWSPEDVPQDAGIAVADLWTDE